MSSTDSAIVTVRLGADLKKRLEALAQNTNRSKSYLAAEAIAAYVDLNEWQIREIEAGIAELDAGEIVPQEEADARFERLLKPR
jgi:RHH-type transcriptional regulator, rel operon repressor / antitoxin RelB